MTKRSKPRRSGRPSAAAMNELKLLLKPWQLITSPVSYGLENVPRGGPGLFVGNHTLFGVFDAPMLLFELYTKRRVVLRALGDHVHFRIPLWRDLLSKYGVVDGTRENCARLMAATESILVFPGGAREVFKRKGEKYRLLWGDRVGFARLAIQHRYPIVPFAAVGAEEAWDILLDADDILPAPLQTALERLGFRTDALMPIVRGVGLTPLPRPERLYFHFAPPIDTRKYKGAYEDKAACWELRETVKRAIEDGIAFLLSQREQDSRRDLLPRLLALASGTKGRAPRPKRR